MRILLIAAVLIGAVVLSTPASAQLTPRTFVWREDAAQSATPGRLGDVYRYVDQSPPQSGAGALIFGTQSRDAGMRGLCEIDTLTVGPREPPAVYAATLYTAPGDTHPGDWNDAYQADLERICSAPTDDWRYFRAPDAVTAWQAVRLLEVLRRQSEQDSAGFIARQACRGELRCLQDPEPMSAARAENLISIESRPCGAFDPTSDDTYVPVKAGCLVMVLRASPPGGGVRLLEIGVRFEPKPFDETDPVPMSVAVFVDQVIFD